MINWIDTEVSRELGSDYFQPESYIQYAGNKLLAKFRIIDGESNKNNLGLTTNKREPCANML